MVYTGEHGSYHWVASSTQIDSLKDLVLRHHRGLYLVITSFDSGSLVLVDEQKAAGWTMQGRVAVSPLLSGVSSIPEDQYDEWYILPQPSFPGQGLEVFVNYGGFTLASPDEVYGDVDPPWDRRSLNALLAIQERFWSQMERILPVTFVAMGDCEVVVSSKGEFIEQVRAAASHASE
jgi:hypothetical protein